MIFFISLLSSLLFFSTVYLNDVSMELIITLFSLVYLLYTISPALVILLDSDINILPSFIVNCPGYQWAWTFNSSFLYFTSYCDHYMISSLFTVVSESHFLMFDIPYYAIFPIWSSIKIFVVSFDVIIVN